MGEKQKKIRQKQRQGDIEKWVQTDSPEIPDREETSESPAGLRQVTCEG